MMINSSNTLAAVERNSTPSIKIEADFNKKDNTDTEMPYSSDLDVDDRYDRIKPIKNFKKKSRQTTRTQRTRTQKPDSNEPYYQ
ncbi:hypothetical protein AYI68_g7156 [Smittium mucronatum]|uniref:Uncharacterized protein n=1 Tax=Smittium mucronatum TaxID=133383 RepID=A0A1R0GPG3_9FUNG|nr:hypothetical protein AYI68_g7156 [Smittium mucronatum]